MDFTLTPGGRLPSVFILSNAALTLGSILAVCSTRLITTMAATTSSSWSRPQMPEPGHIAHLHFGHVFHQHGHAVGLAQDHVLDVIHLVALGQIIIAAVVNQTDAPDVDGLLANADFASADIDVRVAQSGRAFAAR